MSTSNHAGGAVAETYDHVRSHSDTVKCTMLSPVRVMTRDRDWRIMFGGGIWAKPSGDGRKRIPQNLVREMSWKGTLITP